MEIFVSQVFILPFLFEYLTFNSQIQYLTGNTALKTHYYKPNARGNVFDFLERRTKKMREESNEISMNTHKSVSMAVKVATKLFNIV